MPSPVLCTNFEKPPQNLVCFSHTQCSQPASTTSATRGPTRYSGLKARGSSWQFCFKIAISNLCSYVNKQQKGACLYQSVAIQRGAADICWEQLAQTALCWEQLALLGTVGPNWPLDPPLNFCIDQHWMTISKCNLPWKSMLLNLTIRFNQQPNFLDEFCQPGMSLNHRASTVNCASRYDAGGWWHNNCYSASPNGKYGRMRNSWKAIVWYGWKKRRALQSTVLKVRCNWQRERNAGLNRSNIVCLIVHVRLEATQH